MQKESFLENKEILSGKQCNLECFSIWIEPQIVGGGRVKTPNINKKNSLYVLVWMYNEFCMLGMSIV